MNKYKIGKYIVKADSICDAVTIVKTIKNSITDQRVFGFGNFPYEYWLKNNDGEWFLAAFSKKKYERFEVEALRKKFTLKNGKLPDYQEKIVDSIKDGKYVSELKPGDVITKKDGSKWDVVLVRHTPFGIQVRMNSKTSPVKTEEITYRPTDMLAYDSVKDSTGSDIVSEVKRAYPGVEVSQIAENRSIRGENYRKTELRFNFKKIPDKFESANRMFSYIERKYSDDVQVFQKSDKTYVVIIFENLKKDSFQKDSRRINYDDDIIEVTLNGKVVFRGYAEDWLDNNFDSNFKWTGSQYEASNAKGKWVVRVIDSFQKDSLTVRDVIQSLINEETSAISSYNVALETLKDHIPDEAYEAIKAIRDDEQRHVENLYAVLNGNVTAKNLEN